MKRYSTLLLVGILFACVGCNKPSGAPQDGLINQYEQACGACDVQRALLLADQIDRAQLTPEQSVRLIKASNLAAQNTSDQFKRIANSMPYNYWDLMLDRFEELLDEYADILRQKEAGRKVKDKMHRLEDKIETLEDKLDAVTRIE